jgi:serine/threonine protein kinase
MNQLYNIKGSHSVVRLCKCKATKNTFAVKIMRSEDQEIFVHGEREWRILQRLDGHPNIVRGIEYLSELSRGRSYLVMERVQGHSILSYVLDHGRI